MATLEELNQSLGESGSPEAMGFIQKFGQSQEKILKNFNTGVARLFGLPRAAVDLLDTGEAKLLDLVGFKKKDLSNTKEFSILPTTKQILKAGSNQGITFAPGEEPQDLASRITQNLGTSGPLLPVLGPSVAGMESVAAVTAAIGGKLAQETGFGRKHPVLARAIGELLGGLSPSSAKAVTNIAEKGGGIGIGVSLAKKGVKKGVKKAKGLLPSTEKRVLSKLQKEVPSPGLARANLAKEAVSPEGKSLSVAQAAGSPGIARIGKAVEAADPAFQAKEVARNIKLAKNLETKFKGTGNVDDARMFLEAELTNKALAARKTAERLETVSNSSVLAERATNKIRDSFNKASLVERKVWNNLPTNELAGGSNLIREHRNIIANITEGGSKKQVSDFVIEKLGDFKRTKRIISKSDIRTGTKSKRIDNITGKETKKDITEFANIDKSKTVRQIKAGELFNDNKTTASAKAIHAFYSELGREMSILSRQPGTRNKIRILRDLREAALKDLDEANLSSSYRKAIEFSKDLNNKFTNGDIGKILGFAGGETPDPSKALDILVGAKGQKGKTAVQQALKGTPGAKEEIEDFIKVQFALATQNKTGGVINATAGNRFLKNFDELLTGVFPDLKAEIQSAIKKQSSVDDFLGTTRLSDISPLIKERSAVATFLKANPDEEATALFNMRSKRIEGFAEITKKLSQDPTGKAIEGFKTAVATKLFDMARKGDAIDGKKLINALSKFGSELVKAKVFTIPDIKRFKRIADVFDKININASAKSPGAIINDIPSFFQTNLLKILAVRLTSTVKRKLGIGTGFGTSLQEANIAAGVGGRFSKALTNDESEKLLILAIKDKKVMDNLLKKLENIPAANQEALVKQLVDKVKSVTVSDVKSFASKQARGAGKNIKNTLEFKKPAVSAGVIPAANLKNNNEDEATLDNEINTLLSR